MDRIFLAMAYFDLGRVPEAKKQWEKGIAADPELDNAIDQSNLGQKLLKAGALADALLHLRRAYELDPQNQTYRMDYETTRRTVAQR
jgi:tetratricopeptide (TPR) repeat protein